MKPPIILIVFLFVFGIEGQAIAIKGLVRDENKQPLSYCYVVLSKSDSSIVASTLTDSTGGYEFTTNDTGRYFVAAEMTGYLKQYSNTELVGTAIFKFPDIYMKRDISKLGEVTVVSRKKLFEMLPDKMVVNVENSVLATGNSAFEVLRRSPSVSIDKNENVLLKGSGCRIYIDGKPSYLKGSQLTDYLKTLQADAISKIEIISNPSSKYDAEGNAGIINIKLKRNKNNGLNGSLNAGLGYGRYPKENGGVNLNYRQGRFNIFGNGSIGHSESYNQLTYNTVIENNGAVRYLNRDHYWHPFTLWGNFAGGIDYNISKNTVVGILVNNNTDATKARTDNNTTSSDAQHIPFQYINVVRQDTSMVANTSHNVNLKTLVDTMGSELAFDVDYATYNGKSTSVNTNNFYNTAYEATRAPYVFRNDQPSAITIKSAKTDLSYNLPHSYKVETGVKCSDVTTDNNLVADSISNNAWIKDNNRSNHFIYREVIYAGYISGNKTFGKTSIQAGLRAEQTHSKGTSLTLNTVQERNYLNLFPTLFISQTISDNAQLNFSYTRRIQRPRYQSLNPFTFYIDPYTLFAGNPYLKPSYSNSFEVKHGYKQVLFTSLSYNHTINDEVEAVFQDKTTGITTNIAQNAASSDFLFLGITSSLNFSKIWTCDLNTSFSYGRNYSSIPAFSYNTSFFTADISTNHTFTLPKDYKIQTSLYYSIPTFSGITYLKSDYAWNLGIQKQVWKKTATIKLNATSIIGPTAYRAHIKNENLDINWVNKWEGKRLSLNFAWKFGNAKIKASREHHSAVQEEKGRAK